MSELQTLLKHAGTVLIGQLAVMAYSVTDTIVAGRYSADSLAALSVGSAIYVSVFVAMLSVVQALLPLWAQMHGARRPQDIGPSLRQAFYLCSITAALGMVILFNCGPVFEWTSIPAGLRAEAQTYLEVLAWSMPPALLFRMYSTLNQSLGKPRLVTWLQIGSLVVKIPLSIWFCFGGLGIEGHGAVGCAMASLLVNYLLMAVALWMLRTRPLYQPLQIWQRLEPPDWQQIAGFARLGVPSALAVVVEVTSFTLMALFVARLGSVASASHQIATNLTALLYMVPLALAIAASARVGFWRGAQNTAMVRRAALLGVASVLGSSTLLAGLLLLGRQHLAMVYSPNPHIIALAVPLLAWVALYHLADGIQTMCLFLLRCFGVVMSPFVVYGLLLWGVGLGGGYVLAYQGLANWPALQSPVAFWMASALALVATALVFCAMLWQVLQRQRT